MTERPTDELTAKVVAEWILPISGEPFRNAVVALGVEVCG